MKKNSEKKLVKIDTRKRKKLSSSEKDKRIDFLERENGIFKAIDNIRDNILEMEPVMEAIASLLVKEFSKKNKVLGCIIGLTDSKYRNGINIGAVAGKNLKKLDKTYLNGFMLKAREELISKKSNFIISTESPHMHKMASRVRFKGEEVGIIVILGVHAFSKDDLAILKSAGTQIDSAIMQCRDYESYHQLKRVDEAKDRIDAIRDLPVPFDEMLAMVAKEMKIIIPGEAAIFICDKKGKKIELSATTIPDVLSNEQNMEIITNIAERALGDGKMKNWVGNSRTAIHSVICLPLIMKDEKIGVIAAINFTSDYCFREEQEELLRAVGKMMDTAIYEGRNKEKIKSVLGRSVGESVMKKLLKNPKANIVKAKRRDVTVLFIDIRGFTDLSEGLHPSLLARILNDYLGTMAQVALKCGGTVDKFVGDEVMVLFNAPVNQKNHALLAVKTALKMQEAHEQLLKRWSKYITSEIPVGIGIATGEVVVGEFGCPLRTGYTAIGKFINRGARCCSAAAGGQILLWESTYFATQNDVVAKPINIQNVKGLDKIITVYGVTGLKE